jgi:pyroglutamyl-peptidase
MAGGSPNQPPRILVTAFGPYDGFPANASWLALVELTRDLPSHYPVTTRLYPVDFDLVRQRMEADLAAEPDFVLSMGQAPGAGAIQLEAIGINVAGRPGQLPDEYEPLAADGPPAYRSELPLAAWAGALRDRNIPAIVSHHAGTYLCNAALYLAHHFAVQRSLPTKATFIHLPLDPSQTTGYQDPIPSLPASIAAQAVRWMIDELLQSSRS